MSEKQAQRRIGELLEGWMTVMHGRDGVMSREDGSDLRNDELRLPKLTVEERSSATRDDPIWHVSPSHQADHAILMFHNLMYAFDSMVVSDDRGTIRLHLSAEFTLIRALIEAASVALWVLGPEDSDTRVIRALRLKHSELTFSKKLAIRYSELADTDTDGARTAQETFVNGQLEDLATMAANAGVPPREAMRPASPGTIASEAGQYLPALGPALAYWYWSTASSVAHSEPGNVRTLADMQFVGVDVRDQPIAHFEPSAIEIWNHLNVAHQMISVAHQLWNQRAAPSPSMSEA